MPVATTFSSTQLERFRREAKKLGRELSISHSEALDHVARQHSFQNWSLLAKHSDRESAPLNPLRDPPPVDTLNRARKRFYLHGDVLMDDPAKCFCVRCDDFVNLSHFEGESDHDDGQDGEVYLASLARHVALPPARQTARGRPDDAPNVLATRAFAARSAYESSRSPFHRWLEEQRNRDDVVGDLAGDILRDKRFPVNLATRRRIEDQLFRHGDHVVRAIRDAWREFTAASTQTAG